MQSKSESPKHAAKSIPTRQSHFSGQQDLENNLLEEAIRRVKGQTDPVKYQIFDLCVRQNWPAQKVAKLTRTNIGSVYITKRQISKLLKKEIERLRTKLA